MIDKTSLLPVQTPAQSHKKVLRMVDNERMAGKMAAWDSDKTATEKIAATLSLAKNAPHESPDAALTYTKNVNDGKGANEEFGFGDLLDMVNPMQHIPVVSSVYRHITGDEIKPISRIIGGAAYGGMFGAASGLINLIAEQETGSDVTGNILSLATGKRSARQQSALSDPAVMAMADLSYSEKYSRHPYQYND